MTLDLDTLLFFCLRCFTYFQRLKATLWEDAQKKGIRPEAKQEVERLWYEVDFGDDGILKTKDGKKDAVEYLQGIYDSAPHWHPTSSGGGSNSGKSSSPIDDSLARFQKSKEAGNVAHFDP